MTEQNQTGGDVVQLFSGEGDRAAPITAKPHDPSKPRPRQCKHRRTEIDGQHRRLVCRDCGELVEAFDFLLKLTEEDGRWREARDAAKRSAGLAQQRLKDLHREEKNAKARLRRMRAQERDLNNKLTRLDAELRSFSQ